MKWSRTPWPLALRLLVEGLERQRELGEQVGHHLPHEARLDALHRLVARLDGEPREPALVGDLRVDEREAVVDDGALLGSPVSASVRFGIGGLLRVELAT